MDPSLIDFLLGVGIGFIEEDESVTMPESITCPNCNQDFSPEEIDLEEDKYVCPYCSGEFENDM